MHHFHQLKTTKVAKETNDSVHIAFEIPQNLRHEFSFKQGQYLNVRFIFGDEDLRRSYSIMLQMKIVFGSVNINPDIKLFS